MIRTRLQGDTPFFPNMLNNGNVEVCLKEDVDKALSEKDKVIANRDYEIKELKDSLGKLLKAKTEQIMDEVMQKTLIYGDGFIPVEHAMKLVAELRHHKYMRCKAKAEACMNKRWRTDEGFDFSRSTRHMNKWLELAEKFKEVK